jgi:hypothetical protein
MRSVRNAVCSLVVGYGEIARACRGTCGGSGWCRRGSFVRSDNRGASEFPAHGNSPLGVMASVESPERKSVFRRELDTSWEGLRARPQLEGLLGREATGQGAILRGGEAKRSRVPCSRFVSSVMLGGRCSGAVSRAVGKGAVCSLAVDAWGSAGGGAREAARSKRPTERGAGGWFRGGWSGSGGWSDLECTPLQRGTGS